MAVALDAAFSLLSQNADWSTVLGLKSSCLIVILHTSDAEGQTAGACGSHTPTFSTLAKLHSGPFPGTIQTSLLKWRRYPWKHRILHIWTDTIMFFITIPNLGQVRKGWYANHSHNEHACFFSEPMMHWILCYFTKQLYSVVSFTNQKYGNNLESVSMEEMRSAGFP